MDSITCVICGNPIEGILITHRHYEKLIFRLIDQKIGFQCQHCSAYICTAGKRKDHPYGKMSLQRKKYHCPKCGELFVPSNVLLKEDAPINLELREILGTNVKEIDPALFNKTLSKLEGRKWREDSGVKEQLLKQLQTDGIGFINRCLEELVQEIELITPNNCRSIESSAARNRISRIIWLAEIDADWLFEDSPTEEILIYMVEEMKEYIRDDDEYDQDEYPGSIFELLMQALWKVEEVIRSGKLIPVITNILLTDHSVYYRSNAALLLGFIRSNSTAVDALIEALKDEKRPHRPAGGSLLTPKAPSVQETAIISLMNIGEERGLSAVIPRIGQKVIFAENTDIQYSGQNSIEMLKEIGAKAPQLLVGAIKDFDKNALRKDIGKNINELTLIDQIESALDQINM